MSGLGQPAIANTTGRNAGKATIALVLAVLVLPGWGPPSSAVGDNWKFDTDGNGIDDMLDALIAQGDEGPWSVDIHYDRVTIANDEAILSLQHGVDHMHRYNNWPKDILAIVDIDNVYDIAGMPDVYGVELLPEPVEEPLPEPDQETDASVHAVRVREYPLVADGYDHNDAVFEDKDLTGNGTVIAVIDGGVDNTHAALDDMDDDPQTLNDHKLVQKDGGPTGTLYGGLQVVEDLTTELCIDPPPHTEHGTAVAGIALGTGAGVGLPGMAPGARLVDISLRNETNLLIAGYQVALDWILDFNNGVSCYGDPGHDAIDIVVISRGISAGDPTRDTPKRLTALVQNGITVVASAGNSGGLNNGFEGGIIVANTNISFTVDRADDAIYWKSQQGPRGTSDGDADALDELMPHIAAPGEHVLAPAPGTLTGYRPFGGTSSAAPHIAGIAALMLQANPWLRPLEKGSLQAMGDPDAVPIRDLLIKTAQYKTERQPSPVPCVFPPCFTPDPFDERTGMFNLTWNNSWGYGLVDAYNATVAAENYQP